jgi:TRAP-type mannitol/chloroaromatic compound transport system substrate-binding protein
MKRRSFIKKSVVAGAAATVAAAASFPAPAIAQGKRELKMVTSWPKNLPGLGTSAQWAADRITQLSGGRLTVKLFAAGELVPPFGTFDAISQGTADMHHSAPFLYVGKSKAMAFFSTIPFGLTSSELVAWMEFGGGDALFDEVCAPFNIKPFLAGVPDYTFMGWLNKEIKTVDDIKGLKYRMPGIGGEALKRLGATVVNLPAGELLPALQSGAIDGTEWAGPYGDLGMGFYKVTKFYYYPGFHEPGTGVDIAINANVWKSLSKDDQELILVVSKAAITRCLGEFTAGNGKAVTTLVDQHKVQLRRIPDEILKALAKHVNDALEEYGNSDPLTKKVYDNFKAFRKEMHTSAQIGNESYLAARRLALG